MMEGATPLLAEALQGHTEVGQQIILKNADGRRRVLL